MITSRQQQPDLKEIAKGLRFPEGPIALPDGSFLVMEIERQCLSRIAADGTITPVAFTGGGPNGAAIGPDGKCYICNNGGFGWHEDENGLRPGGQPKDYSGGRIERVDSATGAVERLYDGTEHGPLFGPNDIVFDLQGGFWFTDRGKTRKREMDLGAIYYATVDGRSIRQVIPSFVSPNGIGLSPAEDRLYVADTIGGRVWEYEITAPGEVRLLPWPSPNGGRLLASGGGYNRFDSLAVDAAGNVCVATLLEGGITVISPDGGSVEFVPIPDRMTTNICFGGPGLRTAYLTLSMSGRLMAMEWPRPGLKLNFLNT